MSKLKTLWVGGGGHWRVKNLGSSVLYRPLRYSAYESRILLNAAGGPSNSSLLELLCSVCSSSHTSSTRSTLSNLKNTFASFLYVAFLPNLSLHFRSIPIFVSFSPQSFSMFSSSAFVSPSITSPMQWIFCFQRFVWTKLVQPNRQPLLQCAL